MDGELAAIVGELDDIAATVGMLAASANGTGGNGPNRTGLGAQWAGDPEAGWGTWTDCAPGATTELLRLASTAEFVADQVRDLATAAAQAEFAGAQLSLAGGGWR